MVHDDLMMMVMMMMIRIVRRLRCPKDEYNDVGDDVPQLRMILTTKMMMKMMMTMMMRQ